MSLTALSPLLFNIYAEAMMVEAMEGIEEEIKVGGNKCFKQVLYTVRGTCQCLQAFVSHFSFDVFHI